VVEGRGGKRWRVGEGWKEGCSCANHERLD